MTLYVMSWYAMPCHGMSSSMSGYGVSVTLLSFCFQFAIDGMSQELHRIETEWFAMTSRASL